MTETPQPAESPLQARRGNQLTIAAAVAVTDFGIGLILNSEMGTSWTDIVWVIVHALAIGAVVFLWLPLSAWLTSRLRLREATAEGLTVLVLGLLVAWVEFGLLHNSDHVTHIVVAVFGLLAGWAMRIPPPQPKAPLR